MTEVVEDLLAELGRIRNLLLNGDLGSLADTTSALSRLEASMRLATADRQDLESIRIQARHVARLLEESAKGVRSAIRRVSALSDPAPAFSPYGSDGRREAAPPRPARDRKA